MEGLLSIFRSIVSSGDEFLDMYLSALNEHQILRTDTSSDLDAVTQTITHFLMKSDNKLLGLQLLNNFLHQFPVDVLQLKGSLWTTLAIKSCNFHNLESHSEIVFDTLTTLAVVSKKLPDMTKTFVNQLGKIYESLTYVPASGHIAALHFIEKCLVLYPGGSSGLVKRNIERFLVEFIDIPYEEISYRCGKCQHLLLQVHGAGEQGGNKKSEWKLYQLKLLGSIHAVLDELFVECSELYEIPEGREQLVLPVLQLHGTPVQRAVHLYIRFRNLVGYLVTAICDAFPIEKPIYPKKILGLISRGLGVTCLSLQRNAISDNLALAALLPKMHYHLLELLESLVTTLYSHVRVYYNLILGILADTLKSTSLKISAGEKKPLLNLRIKSYELIKLWCQTMRSGSCVITIAGLLVEEILNDVTPFQSEFALQVLYGARKHISKKVRRRLHKAENKESNLVRAHSSGNSYRKENLSDEDNQPLCIAALQCLQEVLLSSSAFFNPTTIKIIQNKVMEICYDFYELPLRRNQLYHNWGCRYEIYSTLNILCMMSHPLCPPPTQKILWILQTANVRDKVAKIRNHCRIILLNLERLVHPQKDGLMFPIEMRDIRNTFIKLGQENLLEETVSHDNFQNILFGDREAESVTCVKKNYDKSCLENVSTHNADDKFNKDGVLLNIEASLDSADISGNNVVFSHHENAAKSPGSGRQQKIANSFLKLYSDSERNLSSSTVKIPKLQFESEPNNYELQSVTNSKTSIPQTHVEDNLLITDIEAAFVDELN